MGDNSKTTAILLSMVALGLAYCLWSGTGVSMIGVRGISQEMARADTLRDSIGVLQAKIDTARRDIAKESVEDVKKRVANYRASLVLLRTLVPEQREVTNLLDDVTNRSRVRGVRMTGFQPVTPTPGPSPFNTYAYQFTVVGHYHQVAEFLTDIASLPRIMVPGDVKLVAANPQQARAFGDTTAMLEAHFTVRTYVKATPEDTTHAK
ncbi:MAG TPA: type 4a pilus biogenesis protein PilO [Gemmatimonadales bacterium]|jgi:Tfp pilus assembly protein PilO